MSTSLRRFAGSIATRKVMGWSFPMTLPTWAKPSSESPAEIRSTAALSTWSVSTRACGPNSRTMEAATLVGGGAWIMSELIPDAETQHVGRAGPGLVAQQLVVALERRVVGRLVRETERGDAPRERLVPGRDETRSEEHTSELQSRLHLVCRLLLEKKKKKHKE